MSAPSLATGDWKEKTFSRIEEKLGDRSLSSGLALVCGSYDDPAVREIGIWKRDFAKVCTRPSR